MGLAAMQALHASLPGAFNIVKDDLSKYFLRINFSLAGQVCLLPTHLPDSVTEKVEFLLLGIINKHFEHLK